MASIAALAVELCELQGPTQDANANAITTCLSSLLAACEGGGPEAAQELEDVLMDLFQPLLHAAGASQQAEAHARGVLSVVGATCPPREVLTLTLAALSEGLGEQAAQHDPDAGLASPSFQLFLLRLLKTCLQRGMRRWLSHLSDALCMLLRWAEAALPLMPAGGAAPGGPPGDASGVLTLEAAVEGVAELLEGLVGAAAESGVPPPEQAAALLLLTIATLQLAGAAAVLPAVLEHGARSLAAAAAAAPAIGPRLARLAEPAAAAAWPAAALLRCLPPADRGTALCLQRGEIEASLAALPLGEDILYFSPAEAAQGAALGACLACRGALPGRLELGTGQRLLPVLAAAVPEVVDLAASVQSVALTLLALCAVEAAARELRAQHGGTGEDAGPGTAAAVERLVAVLVLLMCHHPVELLRSGAHEALHALLDCVEPTPRLALLTAMVQQRLQGNTAAAAVALQRLRLEVERAWPGQAAAPLAPSPFLHPQVTDLAAAVLCFGGTGGWAAADADIPSQADALGAAATLYRFVLLKHAGAGPQAEGHFGAATASATLEALRRRDLAPLHASVARELAGWSDGEAGGDQDTRLGLLRLEEVLGCLLADMEERLGPPGS